VAPGDKVLNTTDSAVAWVLVVDNETTLTLSTLSTGAFASTEGYSIRRKGSFRAGKLSRQKFMNFDASIAAGECADLTLSNAWVSPCDGSGRRSISVFLRSLFSSARFSHYAALASTDNADISLRLYHSAFTAGSNVTPRNSGGAAFDAPGEIGLLASGIEWLLEPGDRFGFQWNTSSDANDCTDGTGCVIPAGIAGTLYTEAVFTEIAQ
jgi:hypothetical protein